MEIIITTKFNVGDTVTIKQKDVSRSRWEQSVVVSIEFDVETEKIYYTLKDGWAYEASELE